MKIIRAAFITSMIMVGFTLITGCYRLPEEGEYSVVPATNNPSVVGTHGNQNLLPSGGF